MTIFGFLWFILILVCYLRNDKIQYMVFLTLFSMTLQSTNVIVIGENSIGPQLITSVAFIFIMLLKGIKGKVIKIQKNNKSINFALLLMCIIIVSAVLNNVLYNTLFKILQLFVYILCFCIMYKSVNSIDEDDLYKYFEIITIFVLIMGVVQILITGGFIPRFSIIKTLFYNDDSTTVYFNRTDYKRLCSVFMEPSYCGCFLTASFFYFLTFLGKKKNVFFLLCMIMIEIVLTVSSTAYVTFCIVTVLFLFVSKNVYAKKITMVLGLFSCIVMFTFGYDLIYKAIISKSASGSALVRGQWNKRAFNAFTSSILWGNGYKTLRGSSLIISMLGELGLMGIIGYVMFNYYIIRDKIKNNYKCADKSAIAFALVTIIIGQIIACPDLNFCVYWLIMYFVGLYTNICSQRDR